MSEYTVITQSIVNVTVSSTAISFSSERRFAKDITIVELKGKLELLTGSAAANMKLELYNKDNQLLAKLDNDGAMLGSYPCDDGTRIHVVDSTVKLGEFEDVSRVEKYEMADDDYKNRTDSVRAFKERMKLGRFAEEDPEERKRKEEEKLKKENEEKEKAAGMKVGNRCEVRVPGQPEKRGEVMYIGTTDFKPGMWIGLKYDEPTGKHNGTVGGRQYFTCPDKYGAFTKPANVTVGDFPEKDLFSDDEM